MLNFNFQNFDEEKRNIIVGIAIFAIIVIVDLSFFMKWQIVALKRLNPQLSTLVKDVRSARSDLKLKSSFESRYDQAKVAMLEMEKRIPGDEEVYMILDEISMISKENGLKIAQLKPFKENEKVVLKTDIGAYYQLPIYIDAFGGYHQFGTFLNNIEYSDIFMKTSEIEITQSENDPKNLKIRLVLDTFVVAKQ